MTQETYHFIGIGGIGMSGLARILLERGKTVTGSDIASSYVTQSLEKIGATIHIGHDEKHVSPSSTVIISSDIPQTNPEIIAAKKYECKLLHRSDLLLQLMEQYKVVAIAGTHGKTSTTSLLIHTLKTAGFDPAFAVGGMMHGHETNAQDGKGEYFVAEADESDGTFLKYNYHSAIVTNIDTDHLVHYGTWEKLVSSFEEFMQKCSNARLLFYCQDDKTLAQLKFPGISYGFSQEAQLRASCFQQKGFNIFFDIHFEGKTYPKVDVKLTGKHNALNALAVFGLCLTAGVPESAIRTAFSTFSGVKRRMDKKGDSHSVLLFDDYAHHPTEVKVTLSAVRAAVNEKRVIAVLQPHRYSRMQYSMHEFHNVFDEADLVVVTDLFTANEMPIAGVSTESILAEIKKVNRTPIQYIPRAELVQGLHSLVRPHDVVITMGAGDVTKVGVELASLLQKNAPQKFVVGVLFGGMNCEHEISCISAKNITSHLNRDLYSVKAFQIGLDGRFRRCTEDLKPCEDANEVLSSELLADLAACDLFIPVLHGPYGEDGIIQGFLEVLRKPYVGCDLRSCAICMDKAFMKTLALGSQIATVPFSTFDSFAWKEKREKLAQEIQKALSLPVFVKPTHLGSSVGMTKVVDWGTLEAAIDRAFQYDSHVLVEQGITAREIEFAVLGNARIQVPPPGEVLSNGQFYSYDAKYGSEGFRATPKADLPQDKIEEGRRLAEEIYRAASCQGLARVDFFLDAAGKYWFNEINPFPGFTSISIYPKVWEEKGTLFELMDSFVILALERFRRQEKIFSFSCKSLART